MAENDSEMGDIFELMTTGVVIAMSLDKFIASVSAIPEDKWLKQIDRAKESSIAHNEEPEYVALCEALKPVIRAIHALPKAERPSELQPPAAPPLVDWNAELGDMLGGLDQPSA